MTWNWFLIICHGMPKQNQNQPDVSPHGRVFQYLAVWYKNKFGSQNFGYQIWFCTRLLRCHVKLPPLCTAPLWPCTSPGVSLSVCGPHYHPHIPALQHLSLAGPSVIGKGDQGHTHPTGLLIAHYRLATRPISYLTHWDWLLEAPYLIK